MFSQALAQRPFLSIVSQRSRRFLSSLQTISSNNVSVVGKHHPIAESSSQHNTVAWNSLLKPSDHFIFSLYFVCLQKISRNSRLAYAQNRKFSA